MITWTPTITMMAMMTTLTITTTMRMMTITSLSAPIEETLVALTTTTIVALAVALTMVLRLIRKTSMMTTTMSTLEHIRNYDPSSKRKDFTKINSLRFSSFISLCLTIMYS
jgi:hypothetical protein